MTVGAVGAIVGARAARRRNEGRRPSTGPRVSKEEMDRLHQEIEISMLRAIMKKYDVDHSGKLEKGELSQLLMDRDSGKSLLPTEDELNLVISLADEKHASEGCIDLVHLKPALKEWKGYLKMREPLVSAFHIHDVSRTGKLEPPELKEYLQTMNGNKQVSDEDVDCVLSIADLSGDGACSSPSELYLATKWWSENKKERPHNGQCCVVM